ncbi:SH3 domain-containing protein [Aliihoeflea aestuarii]|uniref:COG3650 family protein n=1 Tax=Aliihoeflea aestuarii TaxID=453840 RepID=UPI002093C414|nr:SH3 domain-containing protein [Aliihoeflea aestuarii]MCO6391835.1 SH3 domain-containing protein [Aliihoeflea aestuarii]
MNQFKIAALSLIFLADPAFATEEQAPEPTLTYRVVDVRESDVLNIRAQPDASSQIVGTLSPDADDLAVAGTRMELNGSVWWQVVGDDGLGWVNARYLAPGEAQPADDAIFPLRCNGTEPFWTLSIGGEEAVFQTPVDDDVTWKAGPMTRAVGLLGRYAVRLESEDGTGHVAAWRNHRFCSDGMSDVGFPYEAMVIAPDGTVYGGCCLRSGR